MLTSHTRSLLLEAGRQSIDLWLRARHLSEPGPKSNARVAYDRLAEEAPWPDQQANRGVLVFIVLPMAAFDTALPERGRTEQEAVERVTGAALMRFIPHLAGLLMPPPAWELTWVERSSERVAVDVTRCYAVDMLRRLDAAPGRRRSLRRRRLGLRRPVPPAALFPHRHARGGSSALRLLLGACRAGTDASNAPSACSGKPVAAQAPPKGVTPPGRPPRAEARAEGLACARRFARRGTAGQVVAGAALRPGLGPASVAIRRSSAYEASTPSASTSRSGMLARSRRARR
jgi:hypothetical protein